MCVCDTVTDSPVHNSNHRCGCGEFLPIPIPSNLYRVVYVVCAVRKGVFSYHLSLQYLGVRERGRARSG